MAEKEVKIKVTTETDTQDVEDLESKLQELKDTKLQMQIESDTAELEEVNSQIEETQNKLDELKADPTVDDSEIQALEDELAELEARQIDLEISVNSAELDQAKASMDDLEASSQQATSSIDGVGGALTAVAATAGLEKMVETADNINNSWNRLELTFAGTGVSIDQLKQKQSELQAATGQTGGTIRNYFNMMGIAGVTNTELLSASFEALSGKAYQTGHSVEEMESKFQRMVMSGNVSSKMLTSLGISAEQLAQAMGVSADEVSDAFKNMTAEERIQALTKAMGDGKQANEMYKNSFQGLKTQAEAALAGLVGAIGQAILPVVIPMLKLATQAISGLTNAFKSLPGPVQAIIGGIGGVALAGAALVGTLGVVGQVIKTVQGGIQALNGIMKAWELVTKAVEMAQAALNIVMSMNPIFLVIIAVVALIAILWYLYNTNESVRAAIDGFIASLRGIAEEVYGTLVGAFQWLTDTWNGLVDAFNSGGQIISDTLGGAFQWLIDSFMGVVTFFQTYGPLIAQILFVMATGGIGAIVLLVANFMGMPNQVGAALQNVITRVVSWVANLVSQFTSGAQRAVNGFISPIRGLVDKVAAELSAVYNTVMRFIQPLIDAFNSLGSAAAWAFSVLGLGQGSPGDIYRAIKNELGWTTDFVKSDATGLVGSTAQLGKDVVKGWGNPTFGYSFDGTANIEGNLSGTNLSEVIRLLSELLDAMRGGDNNGNINNTFNLYGDMDDDKRMEKFLNAVRKELAWNNKTAGRTV